MLGCSDDDDDDDGLSVVVGLVVFEWFRYRVFLNKGIFYLEFTVHVFVRSGCVVWPVYEVRGTRVIEG